MKNLTAYTFILLGLLLVCCNSENRREDTGPRRVELLFLGHDSEHHNSAAYMPMLASALSKEVINLTYTSDLNDLNPHTLSKYDGLVIYANHDSISASQEEALMDFVEAGNGLIPVHSASFCFRNSEKYIELVGAQFQKHETGTFQARITNSEHPVMQQVEEFTTWDETYIHQKHSPDRTILMERVEGEHHEPWTWVKEHGQGRVFYTAYGHDERTWEHPGFHKLMKEGILWAVGDKVKGQWEAYRKDMPTLVYKQVANIPNYEKRDPAPRYQEPLSPQESQKLIQVPVDFELQLFASEPNIINPIAMDWDERGRLWVIETVDYPNTVRDKAGVGDDRIKICEDTDGDGKADKFTIFADKLNIPTSMAFANGGLIVAQAPHFLFLEDTDGDDVADVRKVIIDGWGTFDTHAGPSNLRYGIDNYVWGVVGYSGFEGSIVGKEQVFGQGIYRFKPDVSDFEYISKTSNNTWGLGFTEANDIFASTANNTHSVFMGIPNRYFQGLEGIPAEGSNKIDGHYAMHPITPKVRQVDVFGGFTAAAGHSFYTARNYPKEYWNGMAMVCEPTGHLVHMAKIEKDGAGFSEKDGWNLFASADEWVSPVEAKVGPDGAVWVLDWYNFIIQHNPTPKPDRGGYQAENGPGNAYENPLRDKSHGRIWRVVYKEAEAYEPISLTKEDPEELVEALEHDNMFWRLTAQRLLVERGNTDVLPELYALAKSGKADKGDFNPAAVHALWTIKGLGALENNQKEAVASVKNALGHKDPAVRKAAVQVLPNTGWAHEVIVESGVLQDQEPNTQLAAILAVAEMEPSDAMGKELYQLSKQGQVKNDEWLSKAVYVAAKNHSQGFMAAFLQEQPDFEEKQKQLAAAAENKLESTALDDTGWQTMKLPTMIEAAGLEIDGEIWFRKTLNLPATAAGRKAVISLGPINDSDETFVNGTKVGGMKDSWNKDRQYEIPAGVLKSGKNVVAVKMVDNGGGGGFGGKAEGLYLQVGNAKTALAGDWKYKVTKELNKKGEKNSLFASTSIAEVFASTDWRKADQPAAGAMASGAAEAPQQIRISVIKNEMKFDLNNFTVEAGKPVEIIFDNPDFMQHNLVITKPASLQTVGAAADKLASHPKGAEMNYVPDMEEVLYYTRLLNPEETVKLTFTAPAQAGNYPYVCTFPGHWRIMNGEMKVVKSKTPL
ncbi:membrane-bound dehydrogenase domain-containing protein [Flammeovirgaceae bacterium 311]|nr:membrane-bound dehydrogenase domain-containing protein [Flammeovirgaceae bacterium 311]